LAKKNNRRDIRKALKNLPKGLDDTYDEALRRIRSQDEDDANLAEKVLSYISYAFRPLTITEVRHALAVEPGDVDIDEDALPDEDILVSVCAGLVTLDKQSKIIRLVHYTTQEYFERIRVKEFPDAQTSIATTCLTYISFDVFAKGYCCSDQEMDARMQKYPFLEYAARHWGDHARGDREEAIKGQALKFLRHESKVVCSHQVICLRKYRHSGYSQVSPKSITGLHLVASLGLTEMVRLLLEHEADADAEDSDGQTALHWATQNGHEAAVRMLLEHEADPYAKDNSGQTALHWAANEGHEAIVRLLLEYETDPTAENHERQTALHWAAQSAHEEVVRLLLEHEVDPDTEDIDGCTALSWAAYRGNEAIVRLLLKYEADPNAKSYNRQTPLHLAAQRGHEEVVRLLLEHEADPNVKSYDGQTALYQAAQNGHEAVVQLLQAPTRPTSGIRVFDFNNLEASL
jgi:ankyrin repeat protein